MSPTTTIPSRISNSSSIISEDSSVCYANDEATSTKQPIASLQQDNRLPTTIVFTVSLNENNLCQSRRKFSVDNQLLSHLFLIRLINRVFNLRSNFTLVAKESGVLKCNFPVTDDFDVDGCLMNLMDDSEQQSTLEFIVYKYPQTKEQLDAEYDSWCIFEDGDAQDQNDNFEILPIQNDCIIVTIKPKDNRQETFLQKATGWLYGSVGSAANNCLTKSEFQQMLDPANGRLLDESAFRQRIFDSGCDKSIRDVVWCYLLRVFNETMTNEDKDQYKIKIKQRYTHLKQDWQNRYKQKDSEVHTLYTFIKKDVQRTDRGVKFFDGKENSSLQKLLNILTTYSINHSEPGYVQGMNDMAAPILFVVRDESLAYECFCALMRYMRPLFHSNGLAMNRRLDLLRKTIGAIDIELWKKIEQCDISKLIFTYRWLLLDCKREFPFKDIFRVLECLWASIAIEKFEANNDDLFYDKDDLVSEHRSSVMSSLTNTFSSMHSCPIKSEETLSEQSSIDEEDSGYRDEQSPILTDLQLRLHKSDVTTQTSSVPLGKWLTQFSSFDDENDEDCSDMFTVFLCVALLQQNRSTIMNMSPLNTDADDLIGSHFTRLVRQHNAQHTLQLARQYFRQYMVFKMRVKQLLLMDN